LKAIRTPLALFLRENKIPSAFDMADNFSAFIVLSCSCFDAREMPFEASMPKLDVTSRTLLEASIDAVDSLLVVAA
jgi:hypothetical protein